jgi:arylsulfatase A-like enzyme
MPPIDETRAPQATPPPVGSASLGLLSGAAVGGALIGVMEAVGALVASGGGPRPLEFVGLSAVNGAVIALFVVVLLALPAAAFGARLVRAVGSLPRWIGFWLGLALGVWVQMVAAALAGGPRAPSVLMCVVALALPPAAVAISSLLQAGRARIFGIFLALAPGVVWVELARHAPPGGTDPPPEAPDLLLVTVEGLRGVPGPAPVPRMAALDALAEGGVRFTGAHTPAPDGVAGARAALMGVGPVAAAPSGTVADRLHREGWRTGSFVGRARVGLPELVSGFDRVNRGGLISDAVQHTMTGAVLSAWGWRASPLRADRDTVDAALQWLSEVRADPYRPVFLWVHLAGAAPPSVALPPWDTAYYQGDARDPGRPQVAEALGLVPAVGAQFEGVTDPRYVIAQQAGAASASDEQVGRLVAALEAGGTRPQVVIVVGVSGVALGEGDVWLAPEVVPSEATAAVPIVARASGSLPRGATPSASVSVADVATTMLELAGVAVEPGSSAHGFGGRSLVPVAFGRHGWPYTVTAALEGGGLTIWGDHWSFSTSGAQDEGRLVVEFGQADGARAELIRSVAAAHRAGSPLTLTADQERSLRELGRGGAAGEE